MKKLLPVLKPINKDTTTVVDLGSKRSEEGGIHVLTFPVVYGSSRLP